MKTQGTSLPRLSADYLQSTGPRGERLGQGIVHLGLGSFHRAHQAVYTRAAIDRVGGDWGILGVASRSGAVARELLAQDLLYTVAEISPSGTRCSVPAVHTGALVASQQPMQVVASIGDAATRIVSLTVTENGYTYNPSSKGLNFDHPDVRHDLAGSSEPRSTLGQIVMGLQSRMHRHAGPITILSCDNLNHNGEHTRNLVLEFAASMEGAQELPQWIGQNVSFPSSMVDRIVPATTSAHRELVAGEQRYWDAIPVPAEPFSMWIIEDNFAAGRPAWEAGGAVFSSQVDRYEQLKLRLLNGTHSLIAYLGALSGAATIPESVTSPFIESAARQVLRQEYLPSVQVPDGVNVDEYEEQLFERWRNTALGHRTSQVGTDGSVKLRERIPYPALQYRERGTMPHLLALTVAGYLSCLAPLSGFDPGSHARNMRDPARQTLEGLAARSGSGEELARRALAEESLLGNAMAEWDLFAQRVGELTDTIRHHGVQEAARDALGAAEHEESTPGRKQ